MLTGRHLFRSVHTALGFFVVAVIIIMQGLALLFGPILVLRRGQSSVVDAGLFGGAFVGDRVGAFVGRFVGASDGELVGTMVGALVGTFVGAAVGAFEGGSVGAFVGEFVGTSSISTSSRNK
jgi:hypothetical protein